MMQTKHKEDMKKVLVFFSMITHAHIMMMDRLRFLNMEKIKLLCKHRREDDQR